MVSRISLKKIEPEDLYVDKLPAATRRAFLSIINMNVFDKSKWYLAGGTALALQVGHRQSIGLDFFSNKASFKERLLERKLFATGDWKTTYREDGTLYGEFMKAKMSFIAYPFFVPSNQMFKCGNISILKADDIAAMKIVAISQRGTKRDFIDLYWYIMNKEPLIKVVQRAILQYPGQEHNLSHMLKSLMYFVDAESDPMPKIFFKADWKNVKRYFRREVPKIASILLGLTRKR